MNIEFTDSIKQHKKLYELEEGFIFRPTNSQKIFIKLDKTALSEMFSNSESRLIDYYENLQGHTFNLYDDLIACVNLIEGQLVFLHTDDMVVELDHKLIIEE